MLSVSKFAKLLLFFVTTSHSSNRSPSMIVPICNTSELLLFDQDLKALQFGSSFMYLVIFCNISFVPDKSSKSFLEFSSTALFSASLLTVEQC